jgi:hypothetical protein
MECLDPPTHLPKSVSLKHEQTEQLHFGQIKSFASISFVGHDEIIPGTAKSGSTLQRVDFPFARILTAC